MSFGKRSPSPQPIASAPEGKYRFAAWGIAAVFACAMITGLYLQRVQLLLLFHPASLATLRLPENAVQLRNEWAVDETASLQHAIQAINWSIEQMAALCADRATFDRMQEVKKLPAVATSTFAPESAPNLYRSAKAATAQGMIDELTKRRGEFCRNDYGVAIYDAKIAAVLYSDRRSNRFLVAANRYEEMLRLLKSINQKDNVGHMHLTDDEQRLENCMMSVPPSDGKLLFRCYSASKGVDAMDEELDGIPDSPSPARATTTPAQDAYVSPDIDIRSYCREIHGTNYTIRDVCERVEEEARTAIRSMSVPVEIARESDRIHNSYSIRQVCYRNEITAKERLGG